MTNVASLANDNAIATPVPAARPAGGRRWIVLFALISVLWCALAWMVSRWVVAQRTDALVTRTMTQMRLDVATIGDNFDRVLNRLQGLPAVLAAQGEIATLLSAPDGAAPRLGSRRGTPAADTDAVALSRRLLAVAIDMEVDVIWVMNAAGDCVAASNFEDATTFVGTNYADRAYFQSAKAGKRGQQYAVGRVTNVPGLFFSAPVVADGRFLGVVSIKIDLPWLASSIQRPDAFVTDENGVIILAADKRLEMMALPGAAVHQLPPARKHALYKRDKFETLGARFSETGQLAPLSGSPVPHVGVRSGRSQHGITVHALAPLESFYELRADAYTMFVLLSLSGILLTALVLGVHSYVSRVRQHRASMESKNASLQELNARLNHLATIDFLTEAANRRHFQARLAEELARSGRYGRACSLVAIDIDHFKQVNDRHGHAGGDAALRHFTGVIRGQLRGQDELGRLGGEEFAVLLPETELDSALAVAERIRRAIQREPTAYGGLPIEMTASLGVASPNFPGESPDTLLRRADLALYQAKSQGRNCVAAADAPQRPAKP